MANELILPRLSHGRPKEHRGELLKPIQQCPSVNLAFAGCPCAPGEGQAAAGHRGCPGAGLGSFFGRGGKQPGCHGEGHGRNRRLLLGVKRKKIGVLVFPVSSWVALCSQKHSRGFAAVAFPVLSPCPAILHPVLPDLARAGDLLH